MVRNHLLMSVGQNVPTDSPLACVRMCARTTNWTRIRVSWAPAVNEPLDFNCSLEIVRMHVLDFRLRCGLQRFVRSLDLLFLVVRCDRSSLPTRRGHVRRVVGGSSDRWPCLSSNFLPRVG